MNDLSVIDRFLATFIAYIDSGFGLLGSDVRFLTATLIGIDMTLAALFWAMGGEQDVLGKLIRKILYVGAFAFIINSFSALSTIIFRSFAAAGVTAGGGSLSADDLLKPGRLAGTGFEAAWPLLDQASDMTGFTSFFDNFLTIAILLFAWAVVILAFFILAVQMFVTVIEFKLVSLAGFFLVPFALWNRTSFLAERTLGHVVSSGVKVMVLAVIVGIGANFFGEFVAALPGSEPDIGAAMSLMLAALALFGLGIFAPSVASGLVGGAPQLGAGSAVASLAGAGAAAAIGGAGVAGAARAVGGGALSAIRSGTAMGAAARASYALGQETAGSTSVGAGMGGIAQAVRGVASRKLSDTLGFDEAVARGQDVAWNNRASRQSAGGAADDPAQSRPEWAQVMQRRQDSRHHRHLAAQVVREGDRGGAAALPDIAEKED
ncbi:P-type conjugative transfer protein TrbL [Sphingobium yanoikuyae]|uniref:P-type conjugative transfer protein TrbL n=1 Tax=Sphingobium yanoikuyae TaxID=13690 RepID=UPI0026EF5F95|nr:P-type conjugative transfer protein TrbL [Sphingobium yanoikuyae]